jgi:uncharacterized membrane protein
MTEKRFTTFISSLFLDGCVTQVSPMVTTGDFYLFWGRVWGKLAGTPHAKSGGFLGVIPGRFGVHRARCYYL